ncbi:MAG: hypothetical protein Q4Q53_09065, partial [Methanocorpusculum sp.]|nr:hypothetical protein [Methanocorpusculum sp.]
MKAEVKMNRSFCFFLLFLTGLAPLFCACEKQPDAQNDLFVSAPFANATFSSQFEQNFEDYWKKKTGKNVNIIHEIDGAF